jgi:hypothetical protein
MKSIVVRHRNSVYTTLITPLAEDSKYWYVLEIEGEGNVLDALRYSKIDFDFMGEK